MNNEAMKPSENKNSTFFHSNLIIGSTPEVRHETALKLAKKQMGEGTKILQGVDLIELEPNVGKSTISIEQIRELQTRVSLQPYQSKIKASIIYEAQKATVEAQNCLLKTLEEPPKHSIIILTAPEKDNLIPTIVSRCRLIDLGSRVKSEDDKERVSLETIIKLTKGGRLKFIEQNKEELTERETAINLVDSWLIQSHKKLSAGEDYTTYLKAAKEILAIKKTLSTVNVNVRLALEVLLINLPLLS